MTTAPVPAAALPTWLVDAVMGLVRTAYEAGRAEALADRPEPTVAPDVHTRAEAAAILRISKTTLDNLIESEALPSFKAGRRRLIPDADLRAYMAAATPPT